MADEEKQSSLFIDRDFVVSADDAAARRAEARLDAACGARDPSAAAEAGARSAGAASPVDPRTKIETVLKLPPQSREDFGGGKEMDASGELAEGNASTESLKKKYSATPTLGIKLSATQLLGVRGAIQDKAKKAEPGTEWRAKLKAHSDCQTTTAGASDELADRLRKQSSTADQFSYDGRFKKESVGTKSELELKMEARRAGTE